MNRKKVTKIVFLLFFTVIVLQSQIAKQTIELIIYDPQHRIREVLVFPASNAELD